MVERSFADLVVMGSNPVAITLTLKWTIKHRIYFLFFFIHETHFLWKLNYYQSLSQNFFNNAWFNHKVFYIKMLLLFFIIYRFCTDWEINSSFRNQLEISDKVFFWFWNNLLKICFSKKRLDVMCIASGIYIMI